jgi:hypothetical protein
MFMAPAHRYQLIMGVALRKEGVDQLPVIVADRERTATRMYSLAPTRNFVLTDLVSPDSTRPKLDEFPGTVLRGHFEPNHFEPQGQELISDVVAHVEHIFHFNKFEPEAPPLPTLRYFLFGRGGERFLAHVLTTPPDFDHVIGVRLTGEQLADPTLERALLISLAGRGNQPDERLKEGERVEATIESTGEATGQAGQPPLTLHLELGPENYFETNDLAE